MRPIILAGSLLLSLDLAAAADVYKWVDAQGVTHFGAQPPQGVASARISTATARPAEQKPLAEQPLPKLDSESPSDAQKAIDEKVRQQVAQREAERREYCLNVRTNLAELQNNPRVRIEENGEMRRIGEDERQTRIEQAKKTIAENCDR
jgi:hypothetical protein